MGRPETPPEKGNTMPGMQLPEETIAAIATPPGVGGIGIIRLSGHRALPILQRLFRPRDPACPYTSHRLYYGHLHHPDDGRLVDEVLAVYMAAPNSYTREDIVEIHCHGSFLVLQKVLELVLADGAALAAPGEFTKRAFLNGRIDLTQAEAVVDLLAAKTRKGVDLAQEQLSGGLYRLLLPIRRCLVEIRATLEVAIDFPDEEVEIVRPRELLARLAAEVARPLERLVAGADQGRLYREGLTIVIAGRPNVGKSSLLNTILQEDRALVTAVPGTTRDSIEEVVDIGGIPVRLIDTAGIRSEAGDVEALGIARARGLINTADLVLFLFDAGQPLSEEDRSLYQQVSHKPLLVVCNKIDLCQAGELPDISSLGSSGEWVAVSAREQTGIDALKAAIVARVSASEPWQEEGCAPNFRHKQALLAALVACRQAMESLQGGLSNDLIAVDLQETLACLAEIVGETTSEDILDVIFSQFCLGK